MPAIRIGPIGSASRSPARRAAETGVASSDTDANAAGRWER